MSSTYYTVMYFPQPNADKRTKTAWAKKLARSIDGDRERLVGGARINFRANLHCVPDYLLPYVVYQFMERGYYLVSIAAREFTNHYMPYGEFIDHSCALEWVAEQNSLTTAHVTARDYLVPPTSRAREAEEFYNTNFFWLCAD